MLIGRLCPGDSFGETTVLKGLPMPCSVITDTHVQIGTISTLDVYGKLTSVSTLLIFIILGNLVPRVPALPAPWSEKRRVPGNEVASLGGGG